MNSTHRRMRQVLDLQRAYFLDGKTLDLGARKKALKQLKEVLQDNEQSIAEAIERDFGKSYFDVMSNELGLVYKEISTTLRGLSRWSRPERRRTSLVNLPGKSMIYKLPYGSVLVIAPWNYPVLLALTPVVSALAAGNTVILKPSELTASTSGLLAKLLNETFPEKLLFVREGGVPETSELLELRFDKIFFTGSTRVGRIVMKAAAEHLTPVTLELGGKNPVIVMPDAHLDRTAQRLAWGKLHNGGQACVSPDHVYVHDSIRDELIEKVAFRMTRLNGSDYEPSEMLPRIINSDQYARLQELIDPEKTYSGGKGDPKSLYMEPTVLHGVTESDRVMKEEIFGPVMPFLTFSDLDTLLNELKLRPSPLSLYIFTRNTRLANKIQSSFRSGSGMINDTVVHFVNGSTPFGGFGESGMGSYHGKAGFDCFTHCKTVISKPTWFELWAKYPPYTKLKLKLVKAVMR